MRLLGTLGGSEYILYAGATWILGDHKVDWGSQPPRWSLPIPTFWYSYSYIVHSYIELRLTSTMVMIFKDGSLFQVNSIVRTPERSLERSHWASN